MSQSPPGESERSGDHVLKPDGRRVYVGPEKMRDEMIELFDAQRAYGQRLGAMSTHVRFQPDTVLYRLGNLVPEHSYTEKTRLWLYYRDVLRAAHYHLLYFIEQSRSEEVSEEDVDILDHAAVTARLHQGDRRSPSWNTVDEVYESIRSIGVMSLREQRDRHQQAARQQRRGHHPMSFVEWCRTPLLRREAGYRRDM